ncbi:MAG: hypothetical protein RLZZ553_1361 [Verrucomicrobiota bacterium]|jgi:hypothetical protein
MNLILLHSNHKLSGGDLDCVAGNALLHAFLRIIADFIRVFTFTRGASRDKIPLR